MVFGYFNNNTGFLKNNKNSIRENNFFITSDEEIISIGKYSIISVGSILSSYEKDIDITQMADLIKLFEKYGYEMSYYLEGNFILFIINNEEKSLSIINNRYQSTTLYYYYNDSVLFFANTLKELLDNFSIEKVLDKKSLSTFISNGFSSSEKTQLDNINHLLPTESIFCKEETIHFLNYWDKEIVINRKDTIDLEPTLDTYESLFQKSISLFLDYKKPNELGCLLSGGHDTSFVYIHASKLFNKPIHTFTASFDGWGFDEAPKAESITNMFGGIHHVVKIGSDALDYVPELIRAVEQPVAGSSLPIFLCAKEAKKYVDSLLVGDAGDTLWGEYYPVAEWHKYLSHIPTFLRKSFHSFTSHLKKSVDWERIWEMDHVFGLFDSKNFYQNFFNKLCTYRHFDEKSRNRLFKKEFVSVEPNYCKIDLPFTKNNFADMLIEAKMLYGVYMYMMPPTDKGVTHHGIDIYTPYLNHELMNFINQLPEQYINGGSSFKKLINDAHKRKFHKLALLRHLPKRYVYSLQQSFDVPWHALFKKKPLILDLLLKRLKKRGWYNDDELDTLFEEFIQHNPKPHELCELKDHGYRIFALLSFEVWCMEFLDEMKIPTTHMPLDEYLDR